MKPISVDCMTAHGNMADSKFSTPGWTSTYLPIARWRGNRGENIVAAFLILMGSAFASQASERRCGWLEATSFGPNWKNNYLRLFLSDRDGHHAVEEAGHPH
jgi:hypothetical protein